MARIATEGDDDLITWLTVSPDLGMGLATFSDAVYTKGRLPLRVREVARMAIALANECEVCRNARVDGGAAAGIDDDFYAHVTDPTAWDGYSAAEQVAAEFAHRFATNHVALREDEAFWDRCKAEFDDALLVDLTLSCAMWLGSGRAMRVLDVGQTCKLTLNG